MRRLRLTEDLDLSIHTRLFGYAMEGALGDDADLGSFTRAEIVDFHWQRYTPTNAGLAIVGNVIQEQVAALAERYFGDLPARPAPPTPPAHYPKGPLDIAVHGPVERRQIPLELGARTVGCAHADRWPLEVLEELLGQRLLAELRFRRGLTYTPWAYNVFHRDGGDFAAQVMVLEIAGLAQLADLPDKLPAEARNIVRQLYRLPERERDLVLRHAAQLLEQIEERLGYPSIPPATAAGQS